MKTIISFFSILFIFLFILSSCSPKTVIDENGVEHELINDYWIVIEELGLAQCIVYNPTTKIVYFLNDEAYSGGLTPYYIKNEDGFICGAVYENGQIVPTPYFPIN